MVMVLAAVAAQKEGFTSLVEMLPGFGFHALAMFGGSALMNLKPRTLKNAPDSGAAVPAR
jgi:hypothetical protein